MTFSCPQPPDMDDCKSRKKRCLTGPCVGFAYTEGEECSGNDVFDPNTCQCEQVNAGGTYEIITQSLHPSAKNNGPLYHYFYIDDDPFIGPDGGLYYWNMGVFAVDTGRVCSTKAQCDTGVGCTDGQGNPVTKMATWELFCADQIGGVDPVGVNPNDPCGTGFHNLFAPTWSSITRLEEGLCDSFCGRNPDYDGILPNFRFGITPYNPSGFLSTYSIYATVTGWNRVRCDEPTAYLDITVNYIGPGEMCDYYEGVTCGRHSQTGGSTGLTPK